MVSSQPVISSRKQTALRERYLPTASSFSLKERARSSTGEGKEAEDS
jgi:hypothetical protein